MKRQVCDCDRCGHVIEFDSSGIRVVTGRSMDASGNGYEDDVEMIDLCPDCLLTWARRTVIAPKYSVAGSVVTTIAANEFLDWVKKAAKK